MTPSLDMILVHAPKMRHYYPLLGVHSFANFIPTGLFALADLLDRAGRRVRILNYGVEKLADPDFSLGDYVRKTGARRVGFSLYWHQQCYDTIELAREVRRASPETRIVLGGFTAGLFHRDLIDGHPEIDFVIRGDAEDPLIELDALLERGAEDFSSVPNLTWRDGKGTRENPFSFAMDSGRLEGLNFTRFDLVKNFPVYLKQSSPWWFYGNRKGLNEFFNRFDPPTFHISIGRGCTGECTWCGASRTSLKEIYNRKKLAWREAESVRRSVEDGLRAGYKVFCLTFDPNLQRRDGYYSELFRSLGETGAVVHFTCYGLPQPDVIDAMARRLPEGSKFLISPDTGEERVRRANKGFYYSNAELYECLDLIREKGAKADVCLSIGHGRETVADMGKTFAMQDDILKRYKGYFKINKGIMDLDPGSDLHRNPESYGIVEINRSFEDFYSMHSRPDSGTGFATREFDHRTLMRLKCRHFCPLGPGGKWKCAAVRAVNALGVGPAVFGRLNPARD